MMWLAAHVEASDDEFFNSLPDTCISEADEVTVRGTYNEVLVQAQHAQEDNSSLHDLSGPIFPLGSPWTCRCHARRSGLQNGTWL